MLNKLLFLLGLLLFLIGQFLLAQGHEFVQNQSPIDFVHWFLLIWALCLLPQVLSFPNGVFSFIGKPLSIIGIAGLIGMCVLDFIFWSLSSTELHVEFYSHISQEPSVWNPFMTIGPSSKVFNLGLLILAFNYFKEAIWELVCFFWLI